MSCVIRVENLSKKYVLGHQTHYDTLRDRITGMFRFFGGRKLSPRDEEFWALKDVSFEINRGDSVGIIGRNGAGKSTLLKILSRITPPTSGRVELKGRVASLLEVGTGFHPELTGRENIYLNGAILGMSKTEIRKKFDEIVGFAEVEQFLDTPVKRYSSGMYVRLAFAIAAYLEPEILMVDEVLAVGDAQFQKKCLGKMNDVAGEGRTVLFVSHNMMAIKNLCTRGIMLGAGRVAYEGDVKEAVSRYNGVAVADRISVENCGRRGGSGGIRVRRLWMTNAKGQETNEVAAGEAVAIAIEADVQKEFQDGKSIVAGFGVDTLEGRRIFSCLSSWARREIITKRGKLVLRCVLPSLPLVSDRYLLSAVIIFRGVTLDYVEHCGYLEITRSAEAVSSEGKNIDHGCLDIPYDFEVVDV
jgi:lipopolysaccharide transport system ATP-binding protein